MLSLNNLSYNLNSWWLLKTNLIIFLFLFYKMSNLLLQPRLSMVLLRLHHISRLIIEISLQSEVILKNAYCFVLFCCKSGHSDAFKSLTTYIQSDDVCVATSYCFSFPSVSIFVISVEFGYFKRSQSEWSQSGWL